MNRGWMEGWMDGKKDGWMERRMDEQRMVYIHSFTPDGGGQVHTDPTPAHPGNHHLQHPCPPLQGGWNQELSIIPLLLLLLLILLVYALILIMMMIRIMIRIMILIIILIIIIIIIYNNNI